MFALEQNEKREKERRKKKNDLTKHTQFIAAAAAPETKEKAKETRRE